MDAFKFHHDIRVEKANAILRYRRIQRLTVLFRCVELLVFLVVLSKFSGQFAFSLNLSAEYLRETAVALISPRFVFLLGNAIVVALFFISGGFSPRKGEKYPDFYDEYVDKCRRNQMVIPEAYRINRGVRKMNRCSSQHLVRTPRKEDPPRRELKRSATERPHRLQVVECGERKGATAAAYAEDQLSNEEFRRTVEAFIARQQRLLREEGELPT